MKSVWHKSRVIVPLLIGAIATACTAGSGEPTAALTRVAEETPPADSQQVESAATAVPTLRVLPTIAVTRVASQESQDEPEDGDAPAEPEEYQVSFVEQDDVLNVRSGPGVDADIIGELAPDTADMVITGPGEILLGSLWVPITGPGPNGWVNSRFLVTMLDSEEFCRDEGPIALVQRLTDAIERRDGEELTDLVEAHRGLRWRRHWWNPEVRIERDELLAIFDAGGESYDWGRADGSGLPIVGSFAEVMLPLLERNLLSANQIGCNEILNGGTAGIVQLPPAYEGVNYYSLFRPPAEGESELDWGTWVVGIEKWANEYYLSFMVHYEWEI